MKTESCSHKEQHGNFCSNCGEKLKEELPEYEKKIKEAQFILDRCIAKERDLRNRIVIKMIIISVFIYLLGVFLIPSPVWGIMFTIVGIFFLAAFICSGITWQEEAEKKARKEFLLKYPEHASILK